MNANDMILVRRQRCCDIHEAVNGCGAHCE